MEKYQSPFAYPEEHMRLLGIIAAHWEALELLLEIILAELMLHQHGRIGLLTAHISYANKMDLVTIYVRSAYGQDKEDPRWTEFNKIKTRVTKAYADRNKYVHARWHYSKETGSVLRNDVRTKGGKLDLVDEITTTTMMEAVAKEIADAGVAFTTFFAELGVQPYAP